MGDELNTKIRNTGKDSAGIMRREAASWKAKLKATYCAVYSAFDMAAAVIFIRDSLPGLVKFLDPVEIAGPCSSSALIRRDVECSPLIRKRCHSARSMITLAGLDYVAMAFAFINREQRPVVNVRLTSNWFAGYFKRPRRIVSSFGISSNMQIIEVVLSSIVIFLVWRAAFFKW